MYFGWYAATEFPKPVQGQRQTPANCRRKPYPSRRVLSAAHRRIGRSVRVPNHTDPACSACTLSTRDSRRPSPRETKKTGNASAWWKLEMGRQGIYSFSATAAWVEASDWPCDFHGSPPYKSRAAAAVLSDPWSDNLLVDAGEG